MVFTVLFMLSCCVKGTWVWLADHDLDVNGIAQPQLSIYSGRGILSESAGPVWMIGTGRSFSFHIGYIPANGQNLSLYVC